MTHSQTLHVTIWRYGIFTHIGLVLGISFNVGIYFMGFIVCVCFCFWHWHCWDRHLHVWWTSHLLSCTGKTWLTNCVEDQPLVWLSKPTKSIIHWAASHVPAATSEVRWADGCSPWPMGPPFPPWTGPWHRDSRSKASHRSSHGSSRGVGQLCQGEAEYLEEDRGLIQWRPFHLHHLSSVGSFEEALLV